MIGLTRSDEAQPENLLCAVGSVPPSVASALDSTRDAKNGEGGEGSSEQTTLDADDQLAG